MAGWGVQGGIRADRCFLPCPESLPQFPVCLAGPLSHLRGEGPAWSADGK